MKTRKALPDNGHCPFSFIQTVTVGSGFSPDLLTPSHEGRSRAFRSPTGETVYRRWGLSPRPENGKKNTRLRKNCQRVSDPFHSAESGIRSSAYGFHTTFSPAGIFIRFAPCRQDRTILPGRDFVPCPPEINSYHVMRRDSRNGTGYPPVPSTAQYRQQRELLPCCAFRQLSLRTVIPPMSKAMPSQAQSPSLCPKRAHPPREVPRMPNPPHKA